MANTQETRRIPTCTRLAPDVHRQFKALAAGKGRRIQDVLEELILGWISQNQLPRKAR
jgi:hypothetical protein